MLWTGRNPPDTLPIVEGKSDIVAWIVKTLPTMPGSQVDCVRAVIQAFACPLKMTLGKSDFATDDFARTFSDILRLHHVFSAEAFTKDKFEHAMVKCLNASGHKAVFAPRGNRGHDITVDGHPWSLKSQADSGIKRDKIYISKFMELGKGQWVDEKDLARLRDSMIEHMQSYDRIFTLRCLSNNPRYKQPNSYEYELVEIPKDLLLRAKDGKIEMRHESRQTPKPGYCTVTNSLGGCLCSLYFDGGTERKLQIKDICISECCIHARWVFSIA